MTQQTSVETIEEQIEHEMSKLEMDFNNGVEWSMRIFFASLKQIRNKVWEAKKMHKAEVINFAEKWENGVPHDSKEDLYAEIFKK